VIARDLATGAPRWTARVGLERVEGANILSRGGVVVASVVRHTVGLDAATGRELWRYLAPRDVGLGSDGNPGVVAASYLDADDQTVYVPAWGASVSALDLRTGAVRWVWQPDRAPTDTAAAGRFRSGSMGARVSGDTVFATAWHDLVGNGVRSEAWLLALDRATGRELWRAVLPNARGGAVFGAPALVGRLAVFNTSEVRVYAVDRATGALAWQFRADSTRLTPSSQVEASGDAVYVDGGDSHVYALEARDGRVRWRGAFPTQSTADLLVTGRRVVLPVGRYLYVLDRASGRQVAEVTQPRTTDPLFASPAAYAGGRLFVTVHGAAWSFDEP
jgi:outer membrane protein assembly factor BamB